MLIVTPPIVRSGAGLLNRALFTKTIRVAAAAITDNRQISEYQTALHMNKDTLALARFSNIVAHPDEALAAQGKKCVVLDSRIRAEKPETWGLVLQEGVRKKELGIVPYQVVLRYDYWTAHDILTSILPEEFHDDIPTGFNTAGHIAHLNLRDHFAPYKKVVAEVILDKNAHITTIINKTHDVGTMSVFRTFQYELLAGTHNMNVRVVENSCIFQFNYAEVYWNSKLETEHRRLIGLFQPGDVVCDVMAGIGPFAIPAGKKGVFVWANDLNPNSYEYLERGIKMNKVDQYVQAFKKDGRTFIHEAADLVLQASMNRQSAYDPPLVKGRKNAAKVQRKRMRDGEAPEPTRICVPPTIAHYVMNLPASATTFLHHFRGVYAGREGLFPGGGRPLPMVHVHCFAAKADDGSPALDVCDRIAAELGVPVRPAADMAAAEAAEGTAYVHDVRDVAPSKRMYCASFRLPREVAFAPRS